MSKSQLNLIHGIGLAFVVFLLAKAVNNLVGVQLLEYKKSPISTVMIAIILGLLIGNTYKLSEMFKPGIAFSQKYILRLGIIFLGIRLSFVEFINYGAVAIPLIIICIASVILVIKLLVKKFKISSKMAYLIAIGTTICGATAIVATAPVINAKKAEITYAIANITLFGVIAMFLYPYFANIYFEGDSLFAGLFLGVSIHETAQVAAAGLIYDQQFNSPETLNISTVTKLVRNTFLVIMVPLFAYFYNKGENKVKNYSLLNAFPFFILGFIAMVILRTVGDELFLLGDGYGKVKFIGSEFYYMADQLWEGFVDNMQGLAKVFLSMAMAAVGLSTNFKEIKAMGSKPLIVGLIAAVSVAVTSIITMHLGEKLYLIYLLN